MNVVLNLIFEQLSMLFAHPVSNSFRRPYHLFQNYTDSCCCFTNQKRCPLNMQWLDENSKQNKFWRLCHLVVNISLNKTCVSNWQVQTNNDIIYLPKKTRKVPYFLKIRGSKMNFWKSTGSFEQSILKFIPDSIFSIFSA